MASGYEIDITLSQDTMNTLKNEGFALYGFKAVTTSITGGAPLVWFSTTSFLPTTKVTWTEQYQAFISASQIISNGQIDASNAIDTDLGQIANVSQTGVLTTSTGGPTGAISVVNQGSTPWTTGISQMTNGVAKPMCAIPLNGNMMDEVVPIEKVLLMFASNTVNTGTVIYKAFSSGFMIDLTGGSPRAVSFDINNGWDASGNTWAVNIQPNANLVPLLIGN